MFNSVTSLFSKYFWRYLYPTKLVEGIVASFKLACIRLNELSYLSSTDIELNEIGQWSIVSTSTDNIVSNCVKAVNDSATAASSSIVAGYVSSSEDYKFFIKGLPKNIIAIGKSPDSELAILYTDFIEVDSGYLFKVNPQYMGIVTSKNSDDNISFFALIDNPIERQRVFNYKYKGCLDKDIKEAVKELSNNLVSTNSIASSVYSGSKPSKNVDSIKRTWLEGDFVCALTNNDQFLYSPSTTIMKHVNDPLEKGSILAESNINKYMLFTIADKWYVADCTEDITASVYPNIFTYYPDLANHQTSGKIDKSFFISYFKNLGFTTVDITANELTKATNICLSNHFIGNGEYVVSQRIEAKYSSNQTDIDKLAIIYSFDKNDNVNNIGQLSDIYSLMGNKQSTPGVLIVDNITKSTKTVSSTTYSYIYGVSYNQYNKLGRDIAIGDIIIGIALMTTDNTIIEYIDTDIEVKTDTLTIFLEK